MTVTMQTWEPSYYHHPVEDIEPIPERACSNIAAITAKLFDSFVVCHHRDTGRPRDDIEPLFRRFMALLWLLDPIRYFEGRTEDQVAQYIGFSRSAFSRIVRELSIATGIRNRMMRREGAVQVYQTRQARIWAERRANSEPVESQSFLNI